MDVKIALKSIINFIITFYIQNGIKMCILYGSRTSCNLNLKVEIHTGKGSRQKPLKQKDIQVVSDISWI